MSCRKKSERTVDEYRYSMFRGSGTINVVGLIQELNGCNDYFCHRMLIPDMVNRTKMHQLETENTACIGGFNS